MRRTKSTPLDPPFAHLTTALVAIHFGVPELTLTSSTRGRRHATQARQVAMYLLNGVFSLTQTRIAELFGRDRSTVAHACHVVEDTRDDPLFDAKIERLEDLLYPMAQTLQGARL